MTITTDQSGQVRVFCKQSKDCHHSYRYTYPDAYSNDWIVSPAFHVLKTKKRPKHHRGRSAGGADADHRASRQ